MQERARVEYVDEVVAATAALEHGQRADDDEQVAVASVLDARHFGLERVVRAHDHFLERQVVDLAAHVVEFGETRRRVIRLPKSNINNII